MFLQVLIIRTLFFRNAKLICALKKNTYRKYNGYVGRLKDWWSHFSVRRLDHILAGSTMAAKLYREKFSVPENQITVVHHLGVDTSLFIPGPVQDDDGTRPIIIGYCGRFDRDKGVFDLVDAVQLMKKQAARSVVLRLLGSGTLSHELEQKARVTHWLEVLQPVVHHKVVGFLQGLDIFVLPSCIGEDHQEHDAHALLEALAVGVATIGTRCGIIPEILGDGTGRLVNPEAPKELAAALLELVNNPDVRTTLSNFGRQRAEREFALEVIARRKVEIFQELLDVS